LVFFFRSPSDLTYFTPGPQEQLVNEIHPVLASNVANADVYRMCQVLRDSAGLCMERMLTPRSPTDESVFVPLGAARALHFMLTLPSSPTDEYVFVSLEARRALHSMSTEPPREPAQGSGHG
jgi:hypothetical protein